MKQKIEPVTQWVPEKGLVTCDVVDVEIGRHLLGQPVRGNITLGYDEVRPEDQKDAPARFKGIISGHRDLTPEQVAAWKANDAEFFTHAITVNAGFKPVA